MTIKIVLSSPMRTLPQSLRDSSLSEGAFEKFAAILFCSHRLFFGASRTSPPTMNKVFRSFFWLHAKY